MSVLQTKNSAIGIFKATSEAPSIRPEWLHSFQTGFSDAAVNSGQFLHKTVNKTFFTLVGSVDCVDILQEAVVGGVL
jgi:hypothetical protein